MVKVKCTSKFFDIAAGVDRLPGDEWEVSEARAKAINGTDYGVLVEVAAKPKPRTRAKKETE